MATTPVTFTSEEYEKLKLSLKQINLKARRVQTSTAIEIELRKLQLRFTTFPDSIGPIKKGADRAPLDRDWKSLRLVDIPAVRGYVLQPGATQVTDPVAQRELTAIMTTAAKLNVEIAGGNWGNVEQLCDQFQEEIETAIRECRSVTEEELRQIYTITGNL